MDTLSYKTQSAKRHEVERKWYVVDAEGEVVGRLCSKIAMVLRGKHKASYTPHVDCGDHVIVINAGKVRFTGNKISQKEYQTYSGYPGGQKSTVAKDLLNNKPIRVVELAVKGMLPKNRLSSVSCIRNCTCMKAPSIRMKRKSRNHLNSNLKRR